MSNALAGGNHFYDFNQLGRQTHLGHQVKPLLLRVEPMDRARLGTKMFERLPQRFLQNNLAWAAPFQERDDLFIQSVHRAVADWRRRFIGFGNCVQRVNARARHMAGGTPGGRGGSGGKTS